MSCQLSPTPADTSSRPYGCASEIGAFERLVGTSADTYRAMERRLEPKARGVYAARATAARLHATDIAWMSTATASHATPSTRHPPTVGARIAARAPAPTALVAQRGRSPSRAPRDSGGRPDATTTAA